MPGRVPNESLEGGRIMKGIVRVLSNKRHGEGERAYRGRYSSLSMAIALVLSSLMGAPAAISQTTTSTIEGTIADSQGSVVAGARITVKVASLGIERTPTSNA